MNLNAASDSVYSDHPVFRSRHLVTKRVSFTHSLLTLIKYRRAIVGLYTVAPFKWNR
jgi:hypothetical protein